MLDDALLLVTELVGNAIRHGAAPVTLGVMHRPEGLRVEVTDAGPRFPEPTAGAPTDESGRGLQIVDAIAPRWGVMPAQHDPGKTVWFELDTPPDAP